MGHIHKDRYLERQRRIQKKQTDEWNQIRRTQ